MLSHNARPDQQNTHLIKQLVDDIASTIVQIRTQTSSSEENLLTQQICSALENALDGALHELKTCLTKIAESAKGAIKLTFPESQYHHNQQPENSSQKSKYLPRKATTSTQENSHSQSSAAEGSMGRPCEVSSALLRSPQGGEATNSGSNVDMNSLWSYEPRGSALSSSIANEGAPPKSDKRPTEYKIVSEVNAGARLQEQKVAQSLGTSLPSPCELPVIKNHAPISYDSSLGMPLFGSFTLDSDKSAKLIDPHQRKTQSGDSQILPSLLGTKSLLPAQNVQYPQGDNVFKANSFTSQDVSKSLKSRSSLSEGPTHYSPKPLTTHGDGAQPLFTNSVLCDYTLHRTIDPSADAPRSHTSEESALYHEAPRTLDGLRRSATVANLNDKYTTSSRRPYSTNSSGSCRVRWAPAPQQKVHRVEESSVNNIRTVASQPKSVQV